MLAQILFSSNKYLQTISILLRQINSTLGDIKMKERKRSLSI